MPSAAFRVLLTVLFLLLLAVPVAGHTDLESTNPEDGTTVEDPPVEVVLEFSAALLPGSQPAVRVVDPAGDDLVAADPALDGATVSVPLNLAVAPGEHRVDWVITAADGDEQRGSFAFTFQPPPQIATPPDAEPPPTEPPLTEPAPTAATPTSSAAATPTPTEPASDPQPSEPSPTATEEPDPAGSGAAVPLAIVATLFAVAGVAAFLLRRPDVDDLLDDE